MDKGRNIFELDSMNLRWAGIMNHMSRGHKAIIKKIEQTDSNERWPDFRITVEIIKAK
jgi:hypothetical protein